jgi:3-hydroxy-9,10-secoandrosta-1,3,5(10)-triene-9,17-dione monooxygenase reductase component
MGRERPEHHAQNQTMVEPVDPLAFRRFMARLPTGVSVLTARDGDINYGLTVNAFFSVTLHPPLVLVSLSVDADTTPIVRRTRRFAINLLSAEQGAVSERFAEALPPHEKFRNISFRVSPGGLPLLDDTMGSLECDVREERRVIDHDLIIGEVERIATGPDVAPLLYFRSGYALLHGSDTLELPPARL